jgi:molybdenum cofactor sulfurtransferase
LRMLAEMAGVEAHPVTEETLTTLMEAAPKQTSIDPDAPISLFLYPAQCNYSGARYPWSWTTKIRHSSLEGLEHRWLVAVDAAAYASSAPISLSDVEQAPDFTVISFYKMYGFPTGLAALIVRKRIAPLLQKRYFGGGTGKWLKRCDGLHVLTKL